MQFSKFSQPVMKLGIYLIKTTKFKNIFKY